MKCSTVLILIYIVVLTLILIFTPYEHLPLDGHPPSWAEEYATGLDENGGRILLSTNSITLTIPEEADVTYDEKNLIITLNEKTTFLPYYKIRLIYIG